MTPSVDQPARSVAWGALAGLAGSLCCLGPTAAALLGLGASSALAGWQLGRGAAGALGLALVAAGAAVALRRGAACGLSPARRLGAPALMLVAFALSYGALAYALPAAAARSIAAEALAAAAGPADPAAGLRRLTLSIEKMDCPPCAAQVQRLLAAQGGVAAFVALAEADEVTIDYRPAEVSAGALAGLFPGSYGVAVLGDAPLP